MMLLKDDLSRLLNKFVAEEIALDQEDISSAVKSKEWLLERIKAKIKERTGDPQLYAEDPQIGYGSYFVKVKVTNVDEMDFLLVIDSNSGVFSQGGTACGNGLGTAFPNHKYTPRFMKADGSGVSPAKLLAWLRDICWEVLRPLGGEMPLIDGPAVKVVLKGSGIKFDLVPSGVFERVNDPGNIFYNIPKGDASDGWTLTNPRRDIERVERHAERFEGFRNVVRLVKLVRDSYGLPISSYAIQCAVSGYAEGYRWQSELFMNFHYALIYLEAKLRAGQIPDGFDPSMNLLKDVANSGGHANTIQAVYRRLSALENEPTEDAAVQKLWQILKNTTERRSQPGLTAGRDALARLFYPTAPVRKNPWSI